MAIFPKIALITDALACLAIMPFLWWASSKLFEMAISERPEWFEGVPESIFYRGFPKSMDPNFGARFLRIVFSQDIHELTSPMAQIYVNRIRILYPLSLMLGLSLFIGVFVYAK